MLADKDVDEGMAKDWAAIQDKYAPEAVEVPEPEVPPANDAKTDEGGEKIPVSRDTDGKFKSRQPAEPKPKADEKTDKAAAKEPPEPKAALEPPAAVAENAPAPEGASARDVNRAPSTWKPTARAEWDKLSPAIRAEIHRREADFHNGQQQLLPDASFGKTLRGVIDPYRAMIEAEGGTPERAVADLFRTAALFRTGTVQQKYQAIAQIASQFGLDLKRFAGQPPATGAAPQPAGQPPAEFRDPRVDQLLRQQNEERQAAARREQEQTESTIIRWMNEVDAKGNPKREYLGDVINEMSALVPQIRQSDPTLTHAQALDAAYERATWAHPEIRTLLQQKQQTELEAQRRAENQTRVRDARKAGSVNVPRRGSSPSPGKPGTMDQTLDETARTLGLIA